MKLHWFVPGLIGVLWLAAPAKAGQLATWQFHSSQNRLEFTTDEDVQPRAQLVFDPIRLVIDLPETRLGQAPIVEEVGGAIQQVRIGQFDQQTTRIVVQLAPGYTLDPQQVRFRGISPTQWTVQLPTPQLVDASQQNLSSQTPEAFPSPNAVANSTTNANTTNTNRTSSNVTASNGSASTRTASSRTTSSRTTSSRTTSSRTTSSSRSSASTSSQARSDRSARLAETRSSERQSSTQSSTNQSSTSRTSANRTSTARSSRASQQQTVEIAQINDLDVTDQGLFISTEGKEPKVSVERSRSGGTITIRLENARLSSQLRNRDRQINRYGVDDLELDQDNDDAVEIKLDVSRRSPDWQVEVSDGGILLFPESQMAEKSAAATNDPEPPMRPPAQPTPTLTAEQPSPARPSTSNAVPRVQLATIQGIDLDVSGSQLLIQTDRPVSHQAQWQGGVYVLSLSPAQLAARVAGPQLTPADPLRRVRLRQVDEQTVSVSIQPATGVQFGSLNLITPQMLALEMQRPTPARNVANLQLAPNSSSRSLPNVIPNGRIVVVIDPGHGGNDVGAVGIGNLYEANVVLAISQQVASLLQQQGIQVLMTRNSDVEIDLEPRVQMAEQARASLFVSIHANSMGMDRPDVNGLETYYYSSGAALAETIQRSMIDSLNMTDRGVRQARFYVLTKTSMPAVLVETGFVTGNEDAPRLADAGFQNQMAVAIARGILQYIQQQAMAGSR